MAVTADVPDGKPRIALIGGTEPARDPFTAVLSLTEFEPMMNQNLALAA